MNWTLSSLRGRAEAYGFWPTSRVARIAVYLLGIDLLLFVLEKLLGLLNIEYGRSLGGWVSFLSFIVIVLLAVLAYRWSKSRMLWRLRNRLIVTYVFIGVTPVVLLVGLALGSFYLFAGQFATFIVTTGLNSELSSLASANSAIAHEIASGLSQKNQDQSSVLAGLRRTDPAWAHREVYAFVDGKQILSSDPQANAGIPLIPKYLKDSFRGVVRDSNRLYLRSAETMTAGNRTLVVMTSEPVDQHLLKDLSNNLGEVTLYATGITLSKVQQKQNAGVTPKGNVPDHTSGSANRPEGEYVLDTGKNGPIPTYTAGSVPPSQSFFDRQVTFPTVVTVVNWDTGENFQPIAITVQTRMSQLYNRLFSSLGAFAPTAEIVLLVMAVFFGIIEFIALLIGTRLTRTITKAVAQLYDATGHINQGDFRHRIPVRSSDQIAALANSFNSMTASLEQLIEEQKQKQRMENELAIAQEVQAQLFPREISQLRSLEVHGFCRPARSVSGDYYDFLRVDSEKLLLAVGDISGKGISAALLMATIHSAVRAYSMEGIPLLREPAAVGATSGMQFSLPSGPPGAEVSPSALLGLLNHQLYESTPSEKYATLFLGIYDGERQRITYSNGGHLPPIVMAQDGSARRLDCGGTVVGLFDGISYEEGEVQLRKGEIFLAYSDGVTEPENDFGEFGEQRLIELLRENRELPLARITEIITAAVDDWIGANEQPDDVTLVLARVR